MTASSRLTGLVSHHLTKLKRGICWTSPPLRFSTSMSRCDCRPWAAPPSTRMEASSPSSPFSPSSSSSDSRASISSSLSRSCTSISSSLVLRIFEKVFWILRPRLMVAVFRISAMLSSSSSSSEMPSSARRSLSSLSSLLSLPLPGCFLPTDRFTAFLGAGFSSLLDSELSSPASDMTSSLSSSSPESLLLFDEGSFLAPRLRFPASV
mmetsp:Transcript_19273/g.74017  ORF Transcript_19273/g.74017 Transcript_19273/m.74017 type:complete len:208 (+) Transcript_19273:1249-1872(+)